MLSADADISAYARAGTAAKRRLADARLVIILSMGMRPCSGAIMRSCCLVRVIGVFQLGNGGGAAMAAGTR